MRKETALQKLMKVIGNLFLLLAPMSYLIFIFTITFDKSNTLKIGIITIVTFLVYILIHVGTYKSIVKNTYTDKLRTQVILTNLAFEAVFFALVLTNTPGNNFGLTGTIIALAVITLLSLATLYFQSLDYGGINRSLSGGAFYESIVFILMIIFTIFLICQFYVLWSSWYVFIPAFTGSIMLATIHRNGIIHHESNHDFHLFKFIPVLWGIGLISLFTQFFYSAVLGMALWKLTLIVVLTTGIVVIFIKITNLYERYAGMIVSESEWEAEK